MSSLSDVVRALADQPGVEAVVVASMDGLPIAHEGRAASDPDAVAALAATAIRHAGRLRRWLGARPGADDGARGRPGHPAHRAGGAGAAGCSCWSSRTRISAGCSTTSAAIAPRSRPSCELGRHPRRRFGNPLLAAQHAQQAEAAAPTHRSRLHRRGGGGAARGVHSPRADPGRHRARPRRAAAGPARPAPGQHPHRAPRRLDRTGTRLGHARGAPPRSRGGGALDACRLVDR